MMKKAFIKKYKEGRVRANNFLLTKSYKDIDRDKIREVIRDRALKIKIILRDPTIINSVEVKIFNTKGDQIIRINIILRSLLIIYLIEVLIGNNYRKADKILLMNNNLEMEEDFT